MVLLYMQPAKKESPRIMLDTRLSKSGWLPNLVGSHAQISLSSAPMLSAAVWIQRTSPHLDSVLVSRELVPRHQLSYTQIHILHGCPEADFAPRRSSGNMWRHLCCHTWGRTGGGRDMGLPRVEPRDADTTPCKGQLLQKILMPKMLTVCRLEDPAA